MKVVVCKGKKRKKRQKKGKEERKVWEGQKGRSVGERERRERNSQ